MNQPPNREALSPATVPSKSETSETRMSSRWIGWSSFCFAVIQSVCTAFVALSGLRLFIGALAFGSAVGVLKIADRLHIDAIRIPMMILALVGSLATFAGVWQVRRLRNRSSSAWRQKAVSSKKLNSERLQIALSVLTLVLLVVEYYYHIRLHQS
jgi:cytochrome bd-type quinol oxidase subunit 2